MINRCRNETNSDGWRLAVAATAMAGVVSALFVTAGGGTGMSVAAMTTLAFPPPVPIARIVGSWDGGWWLAMMAMWSSMMVAMMAPTVAVSIAMRCSGRPDAPANRLDALAYPAGYFAPWIAYGCAAAAAEFLLERAGIVHGVMMWSIDPAFSVTLLVAAGTYQLSGWKVQSLRACRQPAQLKLSFASGFADGRHCVVSCGPMMALLFVGGVMNIAWIVALSAAAFAERVLPRSWRASTWLAVVMLLLAGVVVFAQT